MLPILDDYLDRLATVHTNLTATLRDLPVEALDWSPGPEINSLAVLAAHIAGSERYWIGEAAGQEPIKRDRAAEFKTAGVEADALIMRLDASLTHSQSVLTRLTLADLEKITNVKHDDRTVTGAWALQHALEHVSVHLGHMQIMRQLWDQAHP
jgi:uncharacterized damage-inducible protein DinB